VNPQLGEVWELSVISVATVVVVVLDYVPGVHGSDSTPAKFVRCLTLISDWEEKWAPGVLCNWHPAHFLDPNMRIA
jgi:hypothetical protein